MRIGCHGKSSRAGIVAFGLLDDPFDVFGTEEFNSLEDWTATIARPSTAQVPSHGQGPSTSATEFIAAQQDIWGCHSQTGMWKTAATSAARTRQGVAHGRHSVPNKAKCIGYSTLRWNDLMGESGASSPFTLERWILRRVEALKCVRSVLHNSGGTFCTSWELGLKQTRGFVCPQSNDLGVEGSLAVWRTGRSTEYSLWQVTRLIECREPGFELWAVLRGNHPKSVMCQTVICLFSTPTVSE